MAILAGLTVLLAACDYYQAEEGSGMKKIIAWLDVNFEAGELSGQAGILPFLTNSQ